MYCSIMQPNYLPWPGYFNLIARSNHFVFLDDVQFSKNSTQNRNKYLLSGEGKWLTVPVRKVKLNQKINNTVVDETKHWRRKHLMTLRTVYGHHKYFDDAYALLEGIIKNDNLQTLSALNIEIIRQISEELKFQDVTFHQSSAFVLGENRSNRIYVICKKLGCKDYISPPGARGYVEGDGILEGRDDFKIQYQQFVCHPYSQKNSTGGFIPKLSVIDMICNVGFTSAAETIRNGYVISDN